MSAEQRENLDAILRQSAFPAGSDVGELRRLLAELTSAQPLPAGVRVTAAGYGCSLPQDCVEVLSLLGAHRGSPFGWNSPGSTPGGPAHVELVPKSLPGGGPLPGLPPGT